MQNQEESSPNIKKSKIDRVFVLSTIFTVVFFYLITSFGFSNCHDILYDNCSETIDNVRFCSVSVIYNFWSIPWCINAFLIISSSYFLFYNLLRGFRNSKVFLLLASSVFFIFFTGYIDHFFIKTENCVEYLPVTKESCANIGMVDELTCTCEEPDCAEKPEEWEYKESDYCVDNTETGSKHCEFVGMDLAVDMNNSWDVMISADSRYNTSGVDNVILSDGSLTAQISNGGLGWECSDEYDCTESLFFENDLISLTSYSYLHGAFIAGTLFRDSDQIGIIINHINGEILEFTDEEKSQIEALMNSISEL